jgi:uncharacterized protein YndB with AHSA1/START domain
MAKPTLEPETRLSVARTVAAPRETVFRAWTDPKELMRWWAGGPGMSPALAEVDLRVGGRYRLGMRAPDGATEYVCTGVYREVQPPSRLVYTWTWEGQAGPETLVTVEFHDRGGATEIVLTHEGFADAASRDQHTAGWNGCLDSLAKTLEAA